MRSAPHRTYSHQLCCVQLSLDMHKVAFIYVRFVFPCVCCLHSETKHRSYSRAGLETFEWGGEGQTVAVSKKGGGGAHL